MNQRIDQLTKMRNEDPSDPFLTYALALEYKSAGAVEEALNLLLELRKSHPDYLALYYQLGKLHEAAHDDEAALEAYRAGEHLANAVNDLKTRGELQEAIWFLED
ncbi:MAG: tetratricopeptide repeat protein [Flavobacteriales bacterium]|nr:tetratricopeptide repeat protein [Flavobacteriales bacterium]